ncbi:hypothetical protein GCM10008932_03900 [Alkalibacterium iburiense]|uniref:DUF1510 domain-containing protein n=1 Tax=Alkalibacterium iburiense TaxID=290589 RepID=A0ABP3GSZ4_9LACT
MRRTRSTHNQPKKPNQNNNEKIYYIIIGILLVVLLAIVIFIFLNRDTATDLDESNLEPETTEIVDVEESEDTEEDTETQNETDDSETEDETETDTDSDTEEDTDEVAEEAEPETDETEEEADTDEETEDDTAETDSDYEVTEDAPLDESHQVDYADGSSDRVAIANAASAVTGINSSEMITNWVGNDGPGRIFTIVSNTSQSQVYRLTMQYGEGQWHVTGVQELDSVPSEFN